MWTCPDCGKENENMFCTGCGCKRPENNSPNSNYANLLERGFIFLEDGNQEKADEYFEKVLDIDVKCAKAYLGKLLLDLKLKSFGELGNYKSDFSKNPNYLKIVRFGDDALKGKLNKFLERIKTNQQKTEAEKKAKEKAEQEKKAKEKAAKEKKQKEEKAAKSIPYQKNPKPIDTKELITIYYKKYPQAKDKSKSELKLKEHLKRKENILKKYPSGSTIDSLKNKLAGSILKNFCILVLTLSFSLIFRLKGTLAFWIIFAEIFLLISKFVKFYKLHSVEYDINKCEEELKKYKNIPSFIEWSKMNMYL